MDRYDLVLKHPHLFHMADARAWPSICRHGLLPTAALLEAGGWGAAAPRARRMTSAQVPMPGGDVAVVRDQLPLKFLDRVLEPGTSAAEFLEILDARCFFWATEARLMRLLDGRMYRTSPQVVLSLSTESLVAAYGNIIELSPYNSGSAHVPTAPLRGKSTFQLIDNYDYEGWQRRRGRAGDALVEVTVPAPIPDILEHTVDVRRYEAGHFEDLH